MLTYNGKLLVLCTLLVLVLGILLVATTELSSYLTTRLSPLPTTSESLVGGQLSTTSLVPGTNTLTFRAKTDDGRTVTDIVAFVAQGGAGADCDTDDDCLASEWCIVGEGCVERPINACMNNEDCPLNEECIISVFLGNHCQQIFNRPTECEMVVKTSVSNDVVNAGDEVVDFGGPFFAERQPGNNPLVRSGTGPVVDFFYWYQQATNAATTATVEIWNLGRALPIFVKQLNWGEDERLATSTQINPSFSHTFSVVTNNVFPNPSDTAPRDAAGNLIVIDKDRFILSCTPQCDDGIDNDGDGKIDHTSMPGSIADPSCAGDPNVLFENDDCDYAVDVRAEWEGEHEVSLGGMIAARRYPHTGTGWQYGSDDSYNFIKPFCGDTTLPYGVVNPGDPPSEPFSPSPIHYRLERPTSTSFPIFTTESSCGPDTTLAVPIVKVIVHNQNIHRTMSVTYDPTKSVAVGDIPGTGLAYIAPNSSRTFTVVTNNPLGTNGWGPLDTIDHDNFNVSCGEPLKYSEPVPRTSP